jgi:CRISPR-associated protein Csm4
MKIKKISLKLNSGLLSPLHSDTIYGHFCWQLLYSKGENKLTEFINKSRNGNPVFLVSDGLVNHNKNLFFPKPKLLSVPLIAETKYDNILNFIENKEKKNQSLISFKDFNSFLTKGNYNISNSSKKELSDLPLFHETVRTSVEIDRESLKTKTGRLFSYNPVFASEAMEYSLLLKIIDESSYEKNNYEEILTSIFETGFGKKKSSGYGQFTVEDISDFNEIEEPSDSNAFMVLGNYLPSKDDGITPLGYDINTKYGKLGEELSQSENPFKNPIVFLKAGSCFKVEKKKEFYGRVTNQGEISPSFKEAVQFGIPFIIHFKINT